MASFSGDRKRRLLPRWAGATAPPEARDLKVSLGATPSERLRPDQETLDELQVRWKENPSLGIAAELLAVAVVHDEPDCAHDAAAWVTEQPELAGSVLSEIAGAVRAKAESLDGGLRGALSARIGSETSVESEQLAVRRKRRLLRGDFNNPLVWMDLARSYAILGLAEPAGRAMRSAISLAPHHRLVLRSSSRFFVHSGSPDEARHVLIRSGRVGSDPWVAAAEVAVSMFANRAPFAIKESRRLLADSNWRDHDKSELSAALGSFEAQAGNLRNAKKLFAQAVLDPTENVVAQLEWTSRELKSISPTQSTTQLASSAEAMSWHLAVTGRVREALSETRRWFEQEPFSTRPAALGAILAGVGLDDYEGAVEILRRGVRANPLDAGLWLSLVFSLANSGRIDEADAVLSRVHPAASDPLGAIARAANEGLVAFRRRNDALGRTRYEAAYHAAMKERTYSDLAAIVLQYWAVEELNAGASPASEVVTRALASGVTGQGLDLVLARSRLNRRLQALRALDSK